MNAKPSIDRRRAAAALHQCQDTLGIFAQSFPGAAGYEACFRELVAAWEARGQVMLHSGYGSSSSGFGGNVVMESTPPQPQSQVHTQIPQSVQQVYQSPEALLFSFSPTSNQSMTDRFPATDSFSQFSPDQQNQNGTAIANNNHHNNSNAYNNFSPISTSSTSTFTPLVAQPQFRNQQSVPLLGSPASAEAFSDIWAGRLGEMGGRMGGGMRDDFFS